MMSVFSRPTGNSSIVAALVSHSSAASSSVSVSKSASSSSSSTFSSSRFLAVSSRFDALALVRRFEEARRTPPRTLRALFLPPNRPPITSIAPLRTSFRLRSEESLCSSATRSSALEMATRIRSSFLAIAVRSFAASSSRRSSAAFSQRATNCSWVSSTRL